MELLTAPAGRSSTLAVRDAIAESKAGELLAPVRVIVSSNLAGLSLRRMLGSSAPTDDAATGAPAGIANVSFSTPFQFASLLAAPTLAASGLRPLTTSVLAAAVRHVLATEPGRFEAVASHVATESALIRAYGEITEMPPVRRRALADSANTRTLELLAFVDAVGEHLVSGTATRYHDEYTVLQTAAQVARRGSGQTVGRLVIVGPFTQGVATIEFLRDIVASAEAVGHAPVAVWAVTGDEEVDTAAGHQAQQIFGSDAEVKRLADVATPTTLIPAADGDEEVREVVRSILEAAERGVRFDRMAVFVPLAAPYLRTVREQMELAGIPSAGPEYRTLADSMVGRLVMSLLDLIDSSRTSAIDRRFSRESVLALVNSAPLRGPNGRPLRSGPWENVSRKAGVVSGLDGWAHSLLVHTESIETRIADNPTAGEGFVSSMQRELRTARELGEFVSWLGELTSPSAIGRTWSERSEWVRSTLAALLPQENRRSAWPESELDAADRIDKVVSRVGVLDEVEPTLTSSSFVRALQLELDVPSGRRGRFGTGVLVAPLASAVGLDLDEVYILGLAEGICPRPIREDTLIPDEERERTGGGLPLRSDKNRDERQRYLHAVASGSASTTLVMPLGDHRTGRERTASRWWIEALRTLSGDSTINSRNWMQSSVLAPDRRGSFEESLTLSIRRKIAGSEADLALQHLHAAKLADSTPDDEVLPAPLRNGLQMISERLTGFNRFTGDLANTSVPSPTADGRAVSPSLLETWAKCPRSYLLGRVLELGEIERPEEILEISALDRGSLVHEILEDFIRESLEPSPHAIVDADQRWTDADRDRLLQIAERTFTKYENLNRTGKEILWEIRKEETLTDLDTFLRKDEEMRTKHRTIPHDVELPFGMGQRFDHSRKAAEVVLNDGRTVFLRGLVDRVDKKTTDGAPVVIDYKTSKAARQPDFDADPVLGGSKLQLGAYAYAARQELNTEDAHAYYWYTSAKGEFKSVGYRWGDEQDARFKDAVASILDGIDAGHFPPNPGEWNGYFGTHDNCRYCAFNRLCPSDRGEELTEAILSGRLINYVRLVEPNFDEEEAS